jgi:hypothetical protein
MVGALAPIFMTYKDIDPPNWRDGLNREISYKKKFALIPIELNDGSKIWFKTFYRKYITYYSNHGSTVKLIDEEYCHTDIIEDVSAETYVVRKLSENL